MADAILTPCNVACGSGIVTVNSPSGSTLQCDTWFWDDIPLNSPKRPPYWNSTSSGASTLGPGGTGSTNVGQPPPNILVPTAKIRIVKINTRIN